MGESITLRAADAHELGAYVARPSGEPIAGLVVVQEIFGVNAHIRAVADSYAQDGFLAVAPALFDRVERGVDLGYEGPDMQRALTFIPKIDIDKAVLDIGAALDYAIKATGKKVGVIGYCFGGTLAWLAAARLHPAAAVGYYGGRIGNYAGETPTAPVMLHFGKQDTHIPANEVDKVQQAHPDVQVFWYDAGHAFNATPRASYNPEAAKLARERSLAFLKQHLA
jgi:carboxymethylenebutenolidase